MCAFESLQRQIESLRHSEKTATARAFLNGNPIISEAKNETGDKLLNEWLCKLSTTEYDEYVDIQQFGVIVPRSTDGKNTYDVERSLSDYFDFWSFKDPVCPNLQFITTHVQDVMRREQAFNKEAPKIVEVKLWFVARKNHMTKEMGK